MTRTLSSRTIVRDSTTKIVSREQTIPSSSPIRKPPPVPIVTKGRSGVTGTAIEAIAVNWGNGAAVDLGRRDPSGQAFVDAGRISHAGIGAIRNRCTAGQILVNGRCRPA